MSVGLTAGGTHRHAVQFYEEDEFLVQRVAEFLADALRQADPCVVIATGEHNRRFAERLRALGEDPATVRFLDARATVDKLLDGGMPDPRRFRHVIGSALNEVAGPARRVRAYGEMVDLLWRDGRPDAAIRLEELWNDIAGEYALTLLCAYPMGNFTSGSDGPRFRAICTAHDAVVPTERSRDDGGGDALNRRIADLEQRAAALEAEVAYRKQLERRLAEALAARERSEELLRDFVENATIGLHWVAADGTIVWANDAELQLLGYTSEEYIGRHIAHFHADPERIAEILRRLGNNEEIHDFEAPLVAKDGTVKWVAISSNVLFEGGRFVHTRCFSRDITEKKRLQEQNGFLLRATEVLTRSFDYRVRLDTLAHLVVPDLADWCVIDLACEGGYERVALVHRDPALERHGRMLHERWPIPADRDPVLAVLRDGTPRIVTDVTDEFLARMARDEEHLAALRRLDLRSLMMAPMRAQERVVGVMTFATSETRRQYRDADLPLAVDLASRAGALIEIARLYHIAEASNRAKDEFLATLSHELRTPLTAIVGWARMLAVGGLDDPTQRTALATIEQNAHLQARLVDDLLDVSRVVSGKLSLVQEPVDLSGVIADVLQTMRLAADARSIRIEASGLDAGTVVEGDPTRLQQIVWNLVSNAIKFSGDGGPVSVRLERHASYARIVVRDEGRGIEESFLPFVFDAFRQADSTTTRAYGGLGLGLALVKYLVEAHGGAVAAASDGVGKGAVFTVTLPLARRVADRPTPMTIDLSGVL